MGTVLIDNFVILGLHMNCGLWGGTPGTVISISAFVGLPSGYGADFVA